MDYLKIILLLIAVSIAVWVRFGNSLKYYFRKQFPSSDESWKKGEKPFFPKASYNDYSESVRMTSVKHVYEFTDPDKAKKFKDQAAEEHSRSLYINGELVGYTEKHGKQEVLKFFGLSDHHWDEKSRTASFMQSLVVDFKNVYHELEKDHILLAKYRELIAPFVRFTPAANFMVIEERLNITLPHELIYGVSGCPIISEQKTQKNSKLIYASRISSSFTFMNVSEHLTISLTKKDQCSYHPTMILKNCWAIITTILTMLRPKNLNCCH